mmetsp:Transcript_42437/g.95909  ORF Transcript_42437/g.95909 Transcript_42437/m.95909 type:complete len:196 (+) Transcript_42437:540-1127(+)
MGAGCTAGAIGAHTAWSVAQSTMQSSFRAPHAFPSQCGVSQHKFSRSSNVEEVRLWEYRVGQELLREPAAVIVLDDIGRLKDVEAFEHLGRLLCGVGGNSVPEFRTGPGDGLLVPASQALFILTSDLELDLADNQISCEVSFCKYSAHIHPARLHHLHAFRSILSSTCSMLCVTRASGFGVIASFMPPIGGRDCL